MRTKSFPVAWQSGPYRFVGKAYAENGRLHLIGASTGVTRRRRTIDLDGCDIKGVSPRRVAGQPGLIVDHSFGWIEIELLAGSWGAARELADSVATTVNPGSDASAIPHCMFHGLPEAMAHRLTAGGPATTPKEVQP